MSNPEETLQRAKLTYMYMLLMQRQLHTCHIILSMLYVHTCPYYYNMYSLICLSNIQNFTYILHVHAKFSLMVFLCKILAIFRFIVLIGNEAGS